ncbi:unnamed protein product, partial [Anisakis simplex]|uniref:Protein TIFY 5A n=1 Tax=Anisakis simplex TaxID=6269 RepID=A0A0M3KG64_ANISI
MQNNSLGESDEVKAAHGNAYPESYPQLRVGSLWSVTSNGFGQFRTSDEEEQGRRRLEQPAAAESGNESSGIGSGSGSEPGPGPKSPLTSTSSIAVVVANPESNTVAPSDTVTGTVNTVTSTVIIDDSFAEYRQFCANRMRRLERYKKARSFCSGLVQPGADEVGSAADSTLSSLAATSLRGPLPGPAGLSSGPLNSANPRRGRWRPASLVVMGAGDSLEGLELQKLAQVQAQAQAQAQAHQFGINLVPRCPEPPPQPPQPSQSAYGPILSADFPPPPLFCGSSVETRELSGMHVPERSGSSSGYSSGPSSALSSYSGSASSWATQEPPKQPREQGKAQIE